MPPGGVSARLAPIQPVFRLSVSNRAASSPTLSGMASIWKSAKGTATWVAWPAPRVPDPNTWGPNTQVTGSPEAQPSQLPHPATDAVNTRSPMANLFTVRPTSTTVPMNSWPTASPSPTGMSPS